MQYLHSNKRRLNIWQWNCGGISSSRLDEVKAWLVLNHVDLAILVETRMTFAQWSDQHWHILHSGEGPNRGKGIMVLISNRLSKAADIAWQFHDSGRLVHVRLTGATRPLDLVACYQHVFNRDKNRLHARQQWWETLEHILTGIPNRHNLVLAGDFNCSLQASPPHTGTSTFNWRGQAHTGPEHIDQSKFLQLLRRFSLVVLNSWSSQLGPTFIHGHCASRIDYVCVRQMLADGAARNVQYLWDSPFLLQNKVGHAPILCTIAKYWIPVFAHNKIQRVTLQQRRNSRQAFLEQTATWQQFMTQTEQQIAQLFAAPAPDADILIDQMHVDVMETFQRYFPSGQTQRGPPAWQPALSTILNKWEHRRRMLRPGLSTMQNIFQRWFHVMKFSRLKRLHRKQAKQIKQQQFEDMVHTAAVAAAKHDTHQLFAIINKVAPKQPRRQIQLRNHAGLLASPVESAAIMNQFVHDVWAGPSSLDLTFSDAPGVPFTVDQLEHALASIPGTKACAKPFTPGVVWRQHASFLAPLIFAKLIEWWDCNPPQIPTSWKNGWIFMIPKPSKQPVKPQHLRPLALQEPVGKAIIGLIIHLAMKEANDCMVHFPIWAYMARRSTLDAIRRVSQHCLLVRNLISLQRVTPHSRAARVAKYCLYGGLQICLDLQRAFDSVNRCKLFARLHCLNISTPLIQLLASWHENTAYLVQNGDFDSLIPIGKGVRQGCKAAPGLWNCFMVIYMHDLMEFLPLSWIQQHLTLYADDCHFGASFTTVDEFCQIHQALCIMFQVLISLDMTVNPEKSVAILEMRGSSSAKIRSQYVQRDQHGERLKILVQGQAAALIPIQKETKYLGVIISYQNFEDASLKHRLSLMHVGFKRLQRWLTGRHGLSVAQRFQLWRTCIYPILSYGIFAMGLSKQGILKAITQMTIMMRKLTRDHSYLTRRSNQEIFFSSINYPLRRTCCMALLLDC